MSAVYDNCPPAASHTCDECKRVVPRCPQCGDAIGHALRPCPVCNPSNMTADHTVAECGYQERDDCAEAVRAARAEAWDEGADAVDKWHHYDGERKDARPANPYWSTP